MRILYDVTFTRTQHHPTGIPRTVDRLYRALTEMPGGVPVVPVAFHRGQWRQVRSWPGAPRPTGPGARHGSPSSDASWWVRTAAPWLSRRLPMRWRHLAVSTYLRFVFDRLSRDDEALATQAGDVLVLADASWNYAAWQAAARLRAEGGKVVLVVYDIMPLRHPDFCSPVFASLFGDWLRRMLACSDAVVCISRAAEEDLRAWALETGAALPPTDHFRLGHDGVAVDPAATVRRELRDFMQSGRAFAAVGTFEPKKDYGFLLAAFEALWARGEEARLVVAGRSTAQCATLAARFRDHPGRGSALLTLFDANDAEIAHIYRNARALVLTSRFEGFGLPLVEARTQGCLVIANDLPAFRELADGGVEFYGNGQLDTLVALLARHGREEGTAPVPPMPAFTWADSARQCTRVIGRLLRLPAGPPVAGGRS